VRGSFTGASQDKMGLFEYADRGTIFLDEIGDMPLGTQAKLLRTLQNQEVLRVGSLTPRKVDVHVIAATHQDLRKAIAEKRVTEGMDRDQVKLTLGNPLRKYRETKDGDDLEDWIYGQPPGKVTFITFKGNKVVKVKDQYAGLGIETAPRTVVP
jgi:transcriptional regulator of aromatic amino acid metabolism